MTRMIIKTVLGDVEMIEVKLANGEMHTTDLMTMMVMHNHGMLHPDEIDDDGDPKTPEN